MIDVLSPRDMARWLRETATNTRAAGEASWTDQEKRLAPHVAFRLEQAAEQIERLRGNLSLAEEGLANYAQENAELRRGLDGIVDCLRKENEQLRMELKNSRW